MADEPNNKNSDRIFMIALTAAAASIISVQIAKNPVQNKVDKEIKQYVGSNLSSIIKEQEEKLHIKHFGVPKIAYELTTELESDPTIQAMRPAIKGLYLPEEDTIYLMLETGLGKAITPEENLTNILAKILNAGMTYSIKDVIDHELGHFYMDKLNESEGKGDWPTIKTLANNPGSGLISESIAEYFAKTTNNEEDKFNDADWPETIFDWTPNDTYDGGCHFVKPIIDKYGQKGIEYLMENPPTLNDFSNIPAYQKRVLENLANPAVELELYEEQEIQDPAKE